MTTEPNWDEAPEGTTHWEPQGIAAEGWMRLADDGWHFWKTCVGSGWQACNPSKNRILNMMSRPWTGAGLPPVGTVCEFQGVLGYWYEVEITAHARKGLCFVERGKDGENYVALTAKFRPIRTPEQIAEEERKAAIEAMANVIKTIYQNDFVCERIAEQIYDAGYRKAGDA